MDKWIECTSQCLMAYGPFGPLKPLTASGNDLAVLWGFPAGDSDGLWAWLALQKEIGQSHSSQFGPVEKGLVNPQADETWA